MNRARVAFGATLVATMLTAGTALAQTAPPMTQVLAGKKFTPPIKGEALVEFTPPVTKNEKGVVVTVFPDGAEKYLSESFWTAEE